MEPFRSLDEVTASYDADLETGTSAGERVGWMVPHSQLANLIALLQVEGLADGASVLDVGCGLGALKDLLDQRGPRVTYTGIDLSARMIAAATERHPDARFECRDVLKEPLAESFDVVFCSGTFNRLLPDHEDFVTAMLRALWGQCRRSLSFNLLSAHAVARNPAVQRDPSPSYFAWPEDIFRFCTTLSPLVSLDHSSRATTFTVHVYKHHPTPAARYQQHAPIGTAWDDRAHALLAYQAELGLVDEAAAILERLEPSASVENLRGMTLAEQRDFAGAAAAYQRAAALEPATALPHINLGILAARQGHLDEAVPHLERALALEPGDAGAVEAMVKIQIARGRPVEAAAAAVALPDGALREQLLGLTAPDKATAERHFRRAVELAPSLLDAAVRLATLLDERGAVDDAAAAWHHAAGLAPTDPAIARRAARAEQARRGG